MAISYTQMVVRVLGDTTNIRTELNALKAEMSTFTTGVSQQAAVANNTFTNIGAGLSSAGAVMQRVGAGLTEYLTIPLGLVAVAAVKSGIDFERAFTGVKKTVDEGIDPVTKASTSYENLKNKIYELGQETGVSINDIAAAMQVAGQLGIRGDEALGNFTEQVVKLNITTGVSVEQMGMLLGRFTAIMGTDVAANIEGISSVITHLGNNSAATEGDIAKFGVRMAAAGKLTGLTEPQVLAIAAAFESTGTKAERGGTAITKVLLAINSEVTGTKEATDNYTAAVASNTSEIARLTAELENAKAAQANLGADATSADIQQLADTISSTTEQIAALTSENEAYTEVVSGAADKTLSFASILGMTDEEFSTLYKSAGGTSQIFNEFTKKLNEMHSAGKDVDEIFTALGLSDSRLKQAFLSVAQANTQTTDAMGNTIYAANSLESKLMLADDAFNNFNATQQEFNKFVDTTAGQFDRLKSILQTIASIITEGANSALKDYLKNLNDFLITVATALQNMSEEQIAGIVKSILALIALGPGLSLFGGFLKTFGTAFNIMGIGLDRAFLGAGKAIESIDKLAEVAAKKSGIKMWDGTFLDQPGSTIAPGNVVANRANHAKGTGQFMNKENIPNLLGTDLIAQGAEEAGTVYQKNFTQRAFSKLSADYKASIDNFVTNTNNAIADKFEKVKASGPMMPTETFKKKGLTMASGAGAAPDAIVTEGSKLTKYLTLIPELLGKIGMAIPQIAMALGGLSIIVAVVAAGLTLFFMSTGKNANDVKLIFENLVESVKGFGDRISEFIGKLIEGFPAFAAKFGEIFMAIIPWIGELLATIFTEFFNFLPQLLTLGGMFIVSLIEGFVAALPSILDAIVKIIMSIVNGIIKNLPTIIKVGIDIIRALIGGIASAIPLVLAYAVDLILRIGKALFDAIMDGTLIEAGANIVLGLITGILGAVGMLFETLGNMLTDFLKAILEFFGIKSPSKVMAEIGGFIIQGLINGLKLAFELLKIWYWEIPKFLLGVFIGAVKWLWDAGKWVITGLWDGIKWYYSNVFKAAFKIQEWILDGVVGIGSWLYDAGKDLITGLKNGMMDYASRIGSWVSDIGGRVVDGFKSFFGIKSPSRLMKGIGANIGEGLVLGINSSTKDISKAAAEMQQAAMIDTSALQSSMTVDGKVNHDYSGLTDAFMAALEAVGLNVYMDGKDVTDIVSSHMTLAQRRGR